MGLCCGCRIHPGSAGIHFNRYVALAGYLLAALLFIFIITIHWPNFRDASSVENSQQTLSNMLKDLAIAAFALYVASNARHQKMNIAE